MVIIRNKYVPFKGFSAMNFFGILLVRNEVEITDTTIDHEYIHTLQMKEMLYIFFYLWYIIEAAIKMFNIGKKGYYRISFEQEAYLYQDDPDYKKRRKHFAWLKYVTKTQYCKGL